MELRSFPLIRQTRAATPVSTSPGVRDSKFTATFDGVFAGNGTRAITTLVTGVGLQDGEQNVQHMHGEFAVGAVRPVGAQCRCHVSQATAAARGKRSRGHVAPRGPGPDAKTRSRRT